MKTLRSTLAGMALAGVTLAAGAAPLTAAADKDVLFITQKIPLVGPSAVKARTGPLSESANGYGVDFATTNMNPAAIPVSLPKLSFTGAFPTATGLPTKGDALDLAVSHIGALFPAVKSSMTSYLNKYRLSSGWFNFKQELQLDVNGVAETWTVYWSYFSDKGGRGAFPNPKLVPQSPKFLYLAYTQSAVQNGLPAGLALPQAGQLTWQLRDSDFLPVGPVQTFDTGGAFDTPQVDPTTGGTEYLDSGLKCLMDDHNSGCVAGLPNVRALLDATGAVGAVVDYGRRVSAVFHANPDGTQSPVMAVVVDTRDVNYVSCSQANLTDTGRFGYALSSTVGRYFGQATGSPRTVSYGMIQEFQQKYNSPTSSYSYSLPVTKSQVAALGGVVIDPVGIAGNAPGTTLVNATDVPGLTSLAPLNTVGSPSSVLGTYRSPDYHYDTGNDAYRVNLSIRCGDTGSYEIDAFVDHQHGHTGPYVPSGTTTSVLVDDAWTDVALFGHGGARFSALVDTSTQRLLLASKVTSGSYPYNTSGNYANSHNANALVVPSTYTPGHTAPCDPAVVTDGSCVLYANPDGSASYQQVFMGYTTSGSFGGWDLTNGAWLMSNPVVTYDEPVAPGPCVPVGNGQNCPDTGGG